MLSWVASQCPAEAIPTSGYKASATALASRRLITISRKGGTWAATITAAGTHYLEHDGYSEGHWDRRSRRATTGPKAPPAANADEAQEEPASTRQAPRPSAPKAAIRPVDQMLADLAESGCTLRVTTSYQRGDKKPNYDALVRSAIRFNKVPDGKILTITQGDGYDQRIITLDDPPAWMTTEPTPILLPARVTKWHPAAATLRDREHTLTMKARVRRRALLIVHALAGAATARGFSAAAAATKDHYGRHQRPWEDGHLVVTIMEHPFGLKLTEQNDKVPHEPTAQELRDKERYSWTRIPKYDHVPSGRLTLAIANGTTFRQSSWTDRDDKPADLAQILLEMELRAEQAERDRLTAEHAAEVKRQRWQEAMAAATEEFAEHHRAKELKRQVEQWKYCQDLDRYLNAAEAYLRTAPESDHVEAGQQWLDWAAAHRAAIDPITTSLRMPVLPKPDADGLKPYLRGWSFYGPDRSYF